MILSGLQTGNTRWLAGHLQNAAENESIELAEITGTVAQDIDGALAEFDAIAAGTRATESVYAAFINPPQPLSREQFMRAVALMEERLGLAGQPRVILFHTKAGRLHCHAVWSRIDITRMRAIQLSHDRQKLRRCAQELAAAFGTLLPPGLQEDRGAARFDQPKQPTKAEIHMAENSGIAIEERRAAITACYREADSAQAFVNALEAAGYMLARGDSRAFVVVDSLLNHGAADALQRTVIPVDVREDCIRLGALCRCEIGSPKPFEHSIGSKSAGSIKKPAVGRRRLRVLDLQARRILDERGVACERKRRFNARGQDNKEAPLNAEHDLDLAGRKIRLLVHCEHSFFPDFRQGICGELFRRGPEEKVPVFVRARQRHPF